MSADGGMMMMAWIQKKMKEQKMHTVAIREGGLNIAI